MNSLTFNIYLHSIVRNEPKQLMIMNGGLVCSEFAALSLNYSFTHRAGRHMLFAYAKANYVFVRVCTFTYVSSYVCWLYTCFMFLIHIRKKNAHI